MYSAAFIFKPGQYDDEFHRLNGLIDAAANETGGYLGAETWQSADGTVLNATYYWETLERLPVLEGGVPVNNFVELGDITVE